MEFWFKGTKYDKNSFIKEFGIDEKQFETFYESGKKKGVIVDGDINAESAKSKAFKKLMEEINIDEAADNARTQEQKDAENARNLKNESVPKYDKVKFEFSNPYDAEKFANGLIASYGIPSEDITFTPEDAIIVANLTELELIAISAEYKAQKFTAKTVRTANTAIKRATRLADYATQNVALPVGKSAIKNAGSLGKTILTSLAKLGASTVTAITETAKETVDEVKNDPTVIRGVSDFNSAKGAVKSKFGKFTGGNGISIL